MDHRRGGERKVKFDVYDTINARELDKITTTLNNITVVGFNVHVFALVGLAGHVCYCVLSIFDPKSFLNTRLKID